MKKKASWKKLWILLALVLVLTPATAHYCQPVTVQAATVKLNSTKKTLVIGDTYQLKLKGTSGKIKWSTSNKKVAAVSQKGKVTAKKSGTATITAKVGKKKYICKITVVTQQKAYRNQTISLINRQRRRYGYASFDTNTLLQSAAQKRAKELAQKFSHTRPNGYKWTSAISMKYDFKYAAENIACDFAKPSQVVNAWMNKADSKSRIISKKYDEIGVGVYLGSDGYLYWCAIFAKEK